MTWIVLNYCLEKLCTGERMYENFQTEQFVRTNFLDWKTDDDWRRIFSDTQKFPSLLVRIAILAVKGNSSKLYKTNTNACEISFASTWWKQMPCGKSIFRKMKSSLTPNVERDIRGKMCRVNHSGWVWQMIFFLPITWIMERGDGKAVENILMRSDMTYQNFIQISLKIRGKILDTIKKTH